MYVWLLIMIMIHLLVISKVGIELNMTIIYLKILNFLENKFKAGFSIILLYCLLYINFYFFQYFGIHLIGPWKCFKAFILYICHYHYHILCLLYIYIISFQYFLSTTLFSTIQQAWPHLSNTLSIRIIFIRFKTTLYLFTCSTHFIL